MKISNEKIISALLTCPTNVKAAAQLGLSESQLYKRMREEKFQSELKAAKELVMGDALSKLQIGMSEAADALREIVNDRDINPQCRVYASNVLLQNGLRLTEQLDILKRLEALENGS